MSDAAGVVTGSVDALSHAVGQLLDAPLTGLDRQALLDTLTGLETVSRQLTAVGHRLICEVTERGIANDLGHPTVRSLLTGLLRITPADASGRVAAASELGPRRTVTGQPLPPEFPDLAASQRQGAVSAQHAAVIIKTVRSLPATVQAGTGANVGVLLTEHAHQFDPTVLAQLAQRITATLDPDGSLTADADRVRRRDVTLTTSPNGMGRLTGQLTPQLTATLHTVFDALARPSPADGLPDPRTAGQRHHDAGTRLVNTGTLPDTAGVPTTLLITINHSDLATGTGTGRTAHGQQLPAADVLRLAGDADLIPVLLSDTGAVMAYGRTRRLASAAQRRALTARDRGCTLPGCDRPAPWTETHHITAWQHGGPTDLDNLALVCRYHHHALDQGHTCTMINGIPHWTKPPWRDPSQTPHRNFHHHPELLC